MRRDTPTEGLQCVPLGSIASVLVTPAKLARRPRAEIPIAIMDKAAVRDADSPSAEAAATERATFFCTSYIQMRELVLRGCCSAVFPRYLGHETVSIHDDLRARQRKYGEVDAREKRIVSHLAPIHGPAY